MDMFCNINTPSLL